MSHLKNCIVKHKKGDGVRGITGGGVGRDVTPTNVL